MGLLEDEFDDLKALFIMFDFDQGCSANLGLLNDGIVQDGVVSLKEACGMLRCVGFGHHEQQVQGGGGGR